MLTDTKIRALRPRSALYRVADSGGLCIEVSPTGSKLWRYRYRYAGKASMVALGGYPEVSLLEARRRREEMRGALLAGLDPAAYRRAQRSAMVERAANSFGAVVAEWFEKNAHRVTRGTLKRDQRMVERDLAPWIGATPIAEVKASDLVQALWRIQERGPPGAEHGGKAFPVCHCHRPRRAQPGRRSVRRSAEPGEIALCERGGARAGGRAATRDPRLWRSAETMAAVKLAPLVFVRPGAPRLHAGQIST